MNKTENPNEGHDNEDVSSTQQVVEEGRISEELQGQQDTNAMSSPNEGTIYASAKKASSPPRRPQTRSQTGTVSKRRTRDDSDHLPETKKRAPSTRKKQKTSSSPAADASGLQTQDSSASPKPPPTREASLSSSTSSTAPPSNPVEITFYHSSMSEDQVDCRLPRSRATLPTPIPNLTKKSRGRRVPTKDVGTADPDDQRDSRLYVCTVEDCGKCFHRGEHLKRHIRSIHTHEKPFKCTFSLCDKYFNRHDNLLQHLKVHRQAIPHQPVPTFKSVPSTQQISSISSSSTTYHRHRARSYSPSEEPASPVTTTASVPRTIYDAFPTTSYSAYPPPIIYNSGSAGPISLITTNMAVSSLRTDMAVSSLRTEIPQSPTDIRGGGSAMQSNPY